jgi:hypothetical protein
MSDYNRVGAAIARRREEAVHADTNWHLDRALGKLREIAGIIEYKDEAEDAASLLDMLDKVQEVLSRK